MNQNVNSILQHHAGPSGMCPAGQGFTLQQDNDPKQVHTQMIEGHGVHRDKETLRGKQKHLCRHTCTHDGHIGLDNAIHLYDFSH